LLELQSQIFIWLTIMTFSRAGEIIQASISYTIWDNGTGSYENVVLRKMDLKFNITQNNGT
jgi:multidrug transporter EmrE-like cation transporter